MKLDATDLRYVTADEFRVLSAVSLAFCSCEKIQANSDGNPFFLQVEQGSRNHLTVPTQLIAQISKITGGQVNKCLGGLAKRGLVGRVMGAKCEYRQR